MVLGLSFAACEDYDPEVNYYDTAQLDLSSSSFTVLDNEMATTIDFLTTTKTVGAVRLVYDGKEINTGAATNNTYAVTLNRADLGLSEIDDASRLYVYATVDGKEKEMYTTIEMTSASSISDPVDDEDEAVAIYELSDVVKNFTYKVSPKSSASVSVKVETKVGENGTFSTLKTKAYDTDDLNIPLKGSDYAKNDTVFVKLTATAGSFSESVSSSIVISEYLIGAAKEMSLDVEDPGFDLVGDSIIDITEEACTIKFTHDYATLSQGIEAMNSTSLVLVDDEDLMEEENLPLLKAAFDAGTAVTAVPMVEVDAKYIIKHTRGEVVYYGTLVVTEINNVRDGEKDFVKFDCVLEKYDDQK